MTTEPNSNPGLPPGDPFDALRAQAAAEPTTAGGDGYDPVVFLRDNRSLAALAAVMLAGWRCYYVARADAATLANSKLTTAQADRTVGDLVLAMKEKAQEPFSVDDLLVKLESVVLPYVRDLVARSEPKDAVES